MRSKGLLACPQSVPVVHDAGLRAGSLAAAPRLWCPSERRPADSSPSAINIPDFVLDQVRGPRHVLAVLMATEPSRTSSYKLSASHHQYERGHYMGRHDPGLNAAWTRSWDRIARDPQLTVSEKRVLQEITRRVPSTRGEVALADDLIRGVTGLSGPQVRIAIWNLVSKRYISRRGSFCLKMGTISSYRLQRVPQGTAVAEAAPESIGVVPPTTPAFRKRQAWQEHA